MWGLEEGKGGGVEEDLEFGFHLLVCRMKGQGRQAGWSPGGGIPISRCWHVVASCVHPGHRAGEHCGPGV